jgi:5-methylcytosine-specific restriction endonuclease McrA
MTGRVLVLNASYEPFQLIPVRRALVLLLQSKAEVVETAPQYIRSRSSVFALPAVIRLQRYIRLPQRLRLPCSRRGIFARDRDTCQYCGIQQLRSQLTLDHVIPRSQGGATSWENLVAACRSCNHRKGGRTPEQAAMTLHQLPREPHYPAFLLLGELERHEIWRKYSFA